MPTYEYACLSCGRHFEVYQSFSDEPLSTCEVCGGSLRRVFHPVGIVLKGSGFYSTDNRSSKRRGPEPKKDAAETTTETKSETKTDTKTSSGSTEKKSGDTGSSSASKKKSSS